MRYTNSARPIVGILDESTLMTLIGQVQLQLPALFNWATVGFFDVGFLKDRPPRLVVPFDCAQSVTDAVWKDPANPDLSYLATLVDPSMIDLTKAPDGTLDLLNELNFCLQIERVEVNFQPADKTLPDSLVPFMEQQCVLLHMRVWVGLLLKSLLTGRFAESKSELIAFPLDLYAIGKVRLVKGPAELVVEAALRAVEILGLGPDDLTSMIKACALQAAASLIKKNAAKLVLPNSLLQITILKDLLQKDGEDTTDRPSIILQVSFGAQILPSGAGSPEIDDNRVRLVLVPDTMSEEVL
ncbi:MAG TPA: hypothetical protein VMT91_14855 [Anaerolineales bacterium]|nr:hypothetical protein [Anaerolineales bacterium]